MLARKSSKIFGYPRLNLAVLNFTENEQKVELENNGDKCDNSDEMQKNGTEERDTTVLSKDKDTKPEEVEFSIVNTLYTFTLYTMSELATRDS